MSVDERLREALRAPDPIRPGVDDAYAAVLEGARRHRTRLTAGLTIGIAAATVAAGAATFTTFGTGEPAPTAPPSRISPSPGSQLQDPSEPWGITPINGHWQSPPLSSQSVDQYLRQAGQVALAEHWAARQRGTTSRITFVTSTGDSGLWLGDDLYPYVKLLDAGTASAAGGVVTLSGHSGSPEERVTKLRFRLEDQALSFDLVDSRGPARGGVSAADRARSLYATLIFWRRYDLPAETIKR